MRQQTLWFIHRITGVILFAGLTIHFIVMHFLGSDALTHEAVMARLAQPGWIVFNIVFLLSAIWHGFNGLWGICLEYIHAEGTRTLAKGALSLCAVILSITGMYILTLG